ncbi:MAG: peptidylprolyl isomerase [Phototrophicales bacterium]
MAACSGGGTEQSPTTEPQAQSVEEPVVIPTIPPDAEPSLPLDEDGNQIVARVNGQPITLTAFERALARNAAVVSDVASYDALAAFELDKLIEQEVILQAAAEMGIVVSDEAVDAEYQFMRTSISDETEWQNWLQTNHFADDAEFRQLTYYNLVNQRVQEAVLQQMGMPQIPQVRMRHILVDTLEQANAVLARLNAGEDFAVVAAEMSVDETTRSSGGNLGNADGWVVADDLVTPELFDSALQLAPGTYSQPIQTMLGYHIIQTLEVGQRPATSQEAVTLQMQYFNDWLAEQVQSADIERFIN